MISSKQRVLAGVHHQATDRIPITFDAEKEVYAALYDHLKLKTKEELFDRLHVDTWMILPGNFIFPKAEENKAEKTSIWGSFCKAMVATSAPMVRSHSADCSPTVFFIYQT